MHVVVSFSDRTQTSRRSYRKVVERPMCDAEGDVALNRLVQQTASVRVRLGPSWSKQKTLSLRGEEPEPKWPKNYMRSGPGGVTLVADPRPFEIGKSGELRLFPRTTPPIR